MITKKAICDKCESCATNIQDIYGKMPIDLYGLDRYINKDDYDFAIKQSKEIDFSVFRHYCINDIAIGEEAFASILRAKFIGEVFDTPENRILVQRFIISGILTAKGYLRAFEKIKPDRIVCIHGIYQTHGLAVKVASTLKNPAIRFHETAPRQFLSRILSSA